MMSRFQFRAWDGKIMRYAFLVARPQFADGLMLMQDEDFVKEQYNLQEWKVMQFTGLFDKGGNAIWEGDIVEILVSTKFGASRGEKYSICWDQSLAMFVIKIPTIVYQLGGKKVQVIGNIYENPELLQ